MEIRNTEAELQRFRLRAWVMSVVVLLAFGLVVARLLVLQVQRHEELSERADPGGPTPGPNRPACTVIKHYKYCDPVPGFIKD